MITLSAPGLAQHWCAEQRAQGRSLGFVPTMGALHAGHLELVRRARVANERVCVSIFVNPLQFDEKRDFERYPRDLPQDARLLESAGADLAFTGTLAGFFHGAEPAGPRGRAARGALRGRRHDRAPALRARATLACLLRPEGLPAGAGRARLGAAHGIPTDRGLPDGSRAGRPGALLPQRLPGPGGARAGGRDSARARGSRRPLARRRASAGRARAGAARAAGSPAPRSSSAPWRSSRCASAACG